MTGYDLNQALDALNDVDAPVVEEEERYYDGSYDDVDCSPTSGEQDAESRSLFDDFFPDDMDDVDDLDPCFDEYEEFINRIMDEQYRVQDQFASEDRPRSTRFTIHETWRWSWFGLDGTRYSELRVGCRVYSNYRAQSHREMRREWGDQARPGSFRNHGRKPQRKHRDRRPEMRNELQKLYRKTELNRIDPIELAQMNLDENGELDADLEAERDYDERFPLPPPKPKPRWVWLHL